MFTHDSEKVNKTSPEVLSTTPGQSISRSDFTKSFGTDQRARSENRPPSPA